MLCHVFYLGVYRYTGKGNISADYMTYRQCRYIGGLICSRCFPCQYLYRERSTCYWL